MAEPEDRGAASPFGWHDYAITCEPSDVPQVVAITANDALPLRVGDHFTIARPGAVYDLVVDAVVQSQHGRWTAFCNASCMEG